MVVVYHFRYYSSFPWREAFPPLRLGYLGVDFFFILSGLIISHVYFVQLKSGTESFRRFIFLRLARLFPVHALLMVGMLTGSLALGYKLSQQDILDWISLTLFVRQWLLPDGYAWNSPAWSVSAEMFAYAILFPTVLKFSSGAPDGRAGKRLCLIGALLFGLLILQHGSINDTSGLGPLVRVSGGFLFGMGLFQLLAERDRSERWKNGIWMGALVIALGLVQLSEIFVLGGLILITISAYMISGSWEKRLSAPWLYTLGEWSFSLYLCHIPVFRTASWVAYRWGVERGVAFCMVGLIASVICAGLLFRFVEAPCRRGLRLWYDRRNLSSTTASATAQPIG